MAIRITTRGATATASNLRKLKVGLTPQATDAVVAKAAYVTHRRLVAKTPKRWTGQTRKSWRVRRKRIGEYQVFNPNKVMRFLEEGTRAHGPRSARFLYVPLTRAAYFAGAKGALSNPNKFQRGRHYVLAKRVRGIKAMRIVAKERPFAKHRLTSMMRLYIRQILNS